MAALPALAPVLLDLLPPESPDPIASAAASSRWFVAAWRCRRGREDRARDDGETPDEIVAPGCRWESPALSASSPHRRRRRAPRGIAVGGNRVRATFHAERRCSLALHNSGHV